MADPIMKLARAAINDVFSDTSVPATVTRERLAELREEIESMMDTLPDDTDD